MKNKMIHTTPSFQTSIRSLQAERRSEAATYQKNCGTITVPQFPDFVHFFRKYVRFGVFPLLPDQTHFFPPEAFPGSSRFTGVLVSTVRI